MASFRDLCFTSVEFANLAKIDRTQIPVLESQGLLKTVKRKIGSAERKMVTLEDMQGYFREIRSGRHGDQPFGPKNPTHKIQMFYNVKGGTGKSTLTAQYVMKAAMLGLRVLAIDLDGQGHLTVNLDVLDAHERPTVYDVLINDLPLCDAIMNVAPGLDLVPANLGLCNIEIPLNNKARREYRLSEAIQKIADRYDLIVADTNPAASILNGSMLVAAQLVNVVCATNPLSFHGMSLVMATIEEMEREFKHDLDVRIVPNMYDNREVISQEVLGELRSQFPENCTQSVINRSADLNEATKRRTTVWGVNTKGVAAQDISAMTEELLFAPEKGINHG
ncbi:MAG: ParA family protein [Bdellovibrio sp.]|nr:ParA family protein [Bdellovibrio sp.]